MTISKRIMGIDVSAHFLACVCVTEAIDDKLEYFRHNRDKIIKLLPNATGIRELSVLVLVNSPVTMLSECVTYMIKKF